ncbi:MAG TPA: adenylate/guanylate cyclase domain-containing protein [Ktedonobacteraceae bacterium]
MAVSANSPDPAEKTNSDLRSLGEALLRISRMLHEHARKLEVAVEGTYAGDSGDPRVSLLSDSLRVSRTADLELGRLNQNAQRVALTLQERLNGATQSSPVQVPPSSPDAKNSFERERQALTTNISNLERKRNELETLYEIARVLNSTLEFDKVLRLVMDEVIDVVKAERGFLVLVNPTSNQLEFTIARDKEKRTIDLSAFQYQISRSTVERVVRKREPVIADDAMIDDDLKGQKSIMTYGIRSIMCVPLMVRGHCIGAVYVDSRINSNLFGNNHRDLMLAFCHQAAIAIDNARLFADLNQALRRVEEDKSYMDNIFASIANGVITTDSTGIITKFNDAAGWILQIDPMSAVGKHYQEVFRALPQVRIVEFLQNAMLQHDHGTIVPNNVDCEIASRGVVNLSIYVSSLRDTEGAHIGMALVVDDRTELKRSEARVKEVRRIFGRFVHPNVVQRLIDDPMALNLGGEIKEITVISADIRGFTRMSEGMASGEVVNLLNTYLDIMVKEIWDEGGTITGFWGDELMAIFNAPLSQDDHVLRAVRAAWKMRLAVLEYQRTQPQNLLISFGFGVNTGEAMVGNIGSREHMQTYTAIGDAVNVASRLQSNSSDNNILLNHSTFVRVRQHVQVTKLPPLEVKNKTEPLDVWRLIGLY